ncbi:MAG: trypsin-like peptidase domain-containing protein, partial [Rhodothermales bacterium]
PVGRDSARQWYHEFDGESRPRFFDNPLRQSVGSGVLISNEGYIVTNYHVVENAERIQVTLADKRLYDARIIGTDPSTDLAVLKVDDGSQLPVIRLGDSDGIEVGEWVLAIGNPFRLTSTVTAGIISATGRQVNIIEDSFRIEDFIQTDAAINPGNSGGALVNLSGELVGIATAIATESGSYEGYGFAVPVSLVERVVKDIIEHGEVRRGFLGVEIQDLDARLARRLGMDRISGVYVNDVRKRGAAHEAGLQSGDVIVSIDGRAVNASNELQSAIARRRPDEVVDVTVWRRGRLISFGVELLGRDSPAYQEWFSDLRRQEQDTPEMAPPPEDENVFEIGEWGIGLRDLSHRELEAFEAEGGSYVAFVENGSLADEAGLPRDVAIVAIAGEEVSSTEDAIRLLEESARFEDSILLRVKRRDGISAFYEIEVPVPAG